MRKINLSNEAKRDAEVAFGTTFHRPSPVYKTADGNKSISQRSVKATLATADDALIEKFGAALADETTIDDTEEPVEEEIDELDFSMF